MKRKAHTRSQYSIKTGEECCSAAVIATNCAPSSHLLIMLQFSRKMFQREGTTMKRKIKVSACVCREEKYTWRRRQMEFRCRSTHHTHIWTVCVFVWRRSARSKPHLALRRTCRKCSRESGMWCNLIKYLAKQRERERERCVALLGEWDQDQSLNQNVNEKDFSLSAYTVVACVVCVCAGFMCLRHAPTRNLLFAVINIRREYLEHKYEERS